MESLNLDIESFNTVFDGRRAMRREPYNSLASLEQIFCGLETTPVSPKSVEPKTAFVWALRLRYPVFRNDSL